MEEIAGALGWRLSDAEVAELDAVSAKVPRSTGAVSRLASALAGKRMVERAGG